jgi:hypothetical protein
MSFLFGKKQEKEKEETEKEEYDRLLNEKEKSAEKHKRLLEDTLKPHLVKFQRFEYLEKKFNPNKDKPSIVIPTISEISEKHYGSI